MLTVTHKLFIVLTSVYLDVYVSLIWFFKVADIYSVLELEGTDCRFVPMISLGDMKTILFRLINPEFKTKRGVVWDGYLFTT